MKFNGKGIDPHAEAQRIFRAMRSVTVVADGKVYDGDFNATVLDGHVTLDFGSEPTQPTMKALKKAANGKGGKNAAA